MHFSGKIKSRLTIYPSRFFVLIWKVMERKGYWRGSQIPLEGGQAADSSSPIILPNMTRSQSKVKQSDNSSQTYFCNPIWSMGSITEKIPPLKKNEQISTQNMETWLIRRQNATVVLQIICEKLLGGKKEEWIFIKTAHLHTDTLIYFKFSIFVKKLSQ